MAVPFNMPDDQNEVDVLLLQIKTLLNRVQVAVHKNQQSPQPSSSSPSTSTPGSNSNRVRHRVRNRESQTQQTSSQTMSTQGAILPADILTSLSWLANSANVNGSSHVHPSPLTAISVRSPARGVSSESSNPDETMISITAIVKHDCCAQDWNKIDCVETEEPKDPQAEGFLSKIMPTSISSCSLMTAMICFVGWHIFRAR